MRNEVPDLKRGLFSLQADSGAFVSEVRNGGISRPDYNGFVTALVLREMEAFVDPACEEPLNRALGFLQRCLSPGSGMCSFWPSDHCPSWTPYNPEECDSTAVIVAELLHFGRIAPETTRSIVFDSLPGFQAETGAFLAWRSQGVAPNPVDLVLNVNVVAFLAQAGFRDSAMYRGACRAICAAFASCAESPDQLDRLTPYYPDAAEIFLALENALRRGAEELLPAVAALQSLPAPTPNGGAGVLFANEGRRTLWSSEAVLIARRIRSYTKSCRP
jgi:hypothetical protein